MSGNAPDRTQIRQYLLGRLDEDEELEKAVSEHILLDEGLSELADSVEDEIIEEYLDGALDSPERQVVTSYFLRSPQRKEKLLFNRLVQQHFESRPGVVALKDRSTETRGAVTSGGFWQSRVVVFGQLAALLLISILSLGYISVLRNRQTLLETDIARQRANSAELAREASMLRPAMVALTLVSDRSRDVTAQIPRLLLKPSTERMIVEIALPEGSTGSYDVHLETKDAKAAIWSAKLLPIVSPQGDARLVFDVPTQHMTPGIYSFVVSPAASEASNQRYYDFDIKTAD